MLYAAESLFDKMKSKHEIISFIDKLQLSHQTVGRRVEQISRDLQPQAQSYLQKSERFSLQLDECTDLSDIAHLAISVQMVFSDFSVKEEFMLILLLRRRTAGKCLFNVFKSFVKERGISLDELSSIKTDGARSMVGKNNVFSRSATKMKHLPNVTPIIALSIKKLCEQKTQV